MRLRESFNPIDTKIIGVTFDGRQTVCSQLFEGAKLCLEREPKNPHDPNAIGLVFEGRKCGFIPRDLASELAPCIDEGLALEAIVTELRGGNDRPIGVTVKIQEASESQSESEETITDNDFSPNILDWISDEKKPEQLTEDRDDGFRLTEEQNEIISYDIRGNSVLKVIAFAGTGKTTTLLEYSKARPHTRFLYVAFNKSVQLEAENKFPSNVTCKTSHSLAWRKFGAPHKHRLIKILRLNDVKQELRLSTYEEARITLETLKNFLISADPKLHKGHLPWIRKSDSNDQFFYLSMAAKLWLKMFDASSERIGMLHDGYLKQYQLSKPKLDFDCILLDEAQDTNPVVADIILSQSCPKILVGDPHQQIYAFRGAQDAMQHIDAEQNFYLTYSFRFGSEIAWIANKILRTFKNETEELKGRRPKGESDILFRNCAIIARTNAVVFDEAASLCRTDKIAFLGGIEGYRFDDILDVYLLYVGSPNQIKNPYLRSLQTYSEVKAFAEEADDRELKSKCRVVEKHRDQIPQLVEEIKAATVEPPQADFILTTAHKSKGAQFSVVKLCADFPELFADGTLINPESLDPNEFNLLYVAVTRAKESIEFKAAHDWIKFICLGQEPGYERVLEFLKFNYVEKIEQDYSSGIDEQTDILFDETTTYETDNNFLTEEDNEDTVLFNAEEAQLVDFLNTDPKKSVPLFQKIIAQNYPFDIQQLETYYCYLDSDLLTRNEALPWSCQFIARFAWLWNWSQLFKNPKIRITREILEMMNELGRRHGYDLFPCNFSSFAGYARIECMDYYIRRAAPDNFEGYYDEYDFWKNLSGNSNAAWTEELIEKYADNIYWEELSRNCAITWSEELIEKYEDLLDWSSLSDSLTVPWSESLIEKYEDRWDWHYMAGYFILNNENLIDKYKDRLEWSGPNGGVSRFFQVPITVEIIKKYEQYWDWKWLSWHELKIPWDPEVFWLYWDKFDLKYLSRNGSFPWDEEIIERYKEEWNWGALSWNQHLPWSEDLISRYEHLWDWGCLAQNRAIPWSFDLLKRYLRKWAKLDGFNSPANNPTLWSRVFEGCVTSKVIEALFEPCRKEEDASSLPVDENGFILPSRGDPPNDDENDGGIFL
jgi:F-box protein 18 (helicase)